MKANEVPKKIYVSNYSSGLTYNWHNERLAVNDIEYIRTDAFVEKASTWIANRYQANGSYLCADDIEDFVKFMKGE